MKKRNVFGVLLLSIITLGIYCLVWFVKTKGEMKKLGANIPTAWLIIVPLVNIWWLWKYSEGVEHVTGKKTSAILAFVLTWLLGVIGMMILQYEFNKIGDQPAAAEAKAFGAAVPGFGPPAAESTDNQPAQAQTVESEAPSSAPTVPAQPAESTTPAASEAKPEETTTTPTPPLVQ